MRISKYSLFCIALLSLSACNKSPVDYATFHEAAIKASQKEMPYTKGKVTVSLTSSRNQSFDVEYSYGSWEGQDPNSSYYVNLINSSFAHSFNGIDRSGCVEEYYVNPLKYKATDEGINDSEFPFADKNSPYKLIYSYAWNEYGLLTSYEENFTFTVHNFKATSYSKIHISYNK